MDKNVLNANKYTSMQYTSQIVNNFSIYFSIFYFQCFSIFLYFY